MKKVLEMDVFMCQKHFQKLCISFGKVGFKNEVMRDFRII